MALKNLVITGGSGFVGKFFLKKYRYKFNRVILITRRNVFKDFDPKRLDIETLGINSLFQRKTKTFDKFDSVIHLADQNLGYRKSGKICAVLANLAKENGLQDMFYMSSLKVYGEYSDSRIMLARPLKPQSSYALQKVRNEGILKQALSDCSTRLMILRSPNIVGPECKGVVRVLLELINRRLPVPIDSGIALRSLTPLPILAELIYRSIYPSLQTEGEKSSIHLGTFEKLVISQEDLANILAESLKMRLKIHKISGFEQALLNCTPIYGSRIQSLYKPFYSEQSINEIEFNEKPEFNSLVSALDESANDFIISKTR